MNARKDGSYVSMVEFVIKVSDFNFLMNELNTIKVFFKKNIRTGFQSIQSFIQFDTIAELTHG